MNPLVRTFFALAMSGLLLLGQASKPAVGPLEKILKMVTLKLPDASVVSSIQAAGPSLRVTPDDLIRFKEAGASDNVIVALSNAMSGAAPAAKTVPAAAPAAANWNTNLSTIVCDAPAGDRKRVVAVDEFDYGTVQSQVAAIFGTQVDIGKRFWRCSPSGWPSRASSGWWSGRISRK